MGLHVKKLCSKIGKKTILDKITFNAKRGQVLGVIGPNGAGKSTLLKHIAAINPIARDCVSVEGCDVALLPPQLIAKRIAYLAQFTATPRISVLETLELGRRVYSGMMLTSEDRTKLEIAIDKFQLRHLLGRSLDTLSGGERQKVLIATALLQEPDVLLLDEPISHLDPKNQLEMLSAIHEATYTNKLITLIVLHDLQHAIHYCNSLLMLKNTQILHHINTSNLTENMLEEVFDVNTKLHYASGHVFVYFGHQHFYTTK
jgi:iron complex transport system ATP-binding protein